MTEDQDFELTPEGGYENYSDPLMLADALLQTVYSRALKAIRDPSGQQYTDIRLVPPESLYAYCARFEVISHILTFKGIAAFNAGDPTLAARMFQDAIEAGTDEQGYADPFFYLAIAMAILGESENNIRHVANRALSVEPSLASRFDTLIARLPAIFEKETLESWRQLFQHKAE